MINKGHTNIFLEKLLLIIGNFILDKNFLAVHALNFNN
jgi:hypothetical protein